MDAQPDAGPSERVDGRPGVDARRRDGRIRGGDGSAMLRVALLIVWPPYADPMAVDALRAFRGAVLWYVGEGRGVGGGGAADAGDAGRAR